MSKYAGNHFYVDEDNTIYTGQGEVVEKPSVLVDSRVGVLHKYGDEPFVISCYEHFKKHFPPDIGNDLLVITFDPKVTDPVVIAQHMDNFADISGYYLRFVKEQSVKEEI